jgi:ribose transport system permease protein
MSAGVASAAPHRPFRPGVTSVLVALSVVIYVMAAVATGSASQLGFDGFAGLLQRTVALGFVALGQTFVILVGSIDLSVAAVISAVAVMASFMMQGDPAMIAPAIVACLVSCTMLGAVNGVLVAYLGINPLIVTLGTGLIVQGVLASGHSPMAMSSEFLLPCCFWRRWP